MSKATQACSTDTFPELQTGPYTVASMHVEDQYVGGK